MKKCFLMILLFIGIVYNTKSMAEQEKQRYAQTIAEPYSQTSDSGLHVIRNDSSTYFFKGKIFTLIVKDDEIGFLEYIEVPILGWYILHSFFVKSECRHKGYGNYLFQTVLAEIISKGACKIFIQPGPYELDGSGHTLSLGIDEYNKRMTKLIAFYEVYEFCPFKNKLLISLLNLVYKVLGINEDSRYFMIKYC